MASKPSATTLRPTSARQPAASKDSVARGRPVSAQRPDASKAPAKEQAQPKKQAAGTGTSAVRALNARPGKKQGGDKSGKPDPEGLPATVQLAEASQAAVFISVPVAGNSRATQVTGGHGLKLRELSLIVRLRELASCQRLRLELVSLARGAAVDSNVSLAMAGRRSSPSGAKGEMQGLGAFVRTAGPVGGARGRPGLERPLLLVAFPEGGRQRARLPSLLRYGSLADAEASFAYDDAVRSVFGHFAPVFVDKVVDGEAGVLQWRLTGAKCGLPRYIRSFEEVSTLSRLFERIAEGPPEEADSRIASAIRLVDEVFKCVLPRCAKSPKQVDRLNLVDVHADIEFLTLDRGNGEFSAPEYLDGAPAGAFEAEIGSLMADGHASMQDLTKIVADACSRPQKPSLFWADFHSKISQTATFWKLNGVLVESTYQLGFDKMLQDGNNRVWVVDLERPQANATGASTATPEETSSDAGVRRSAAPEDPDEAPDAVPEPSPGAAEAAGGDGAEDTAMGPAPSAAALLARPAIKAKEAPPAAPPEKPSLPPPTPTPRSLFAHVADWLVSGLVLHITTSSLEEEQQLRRLILLLAALPEQFDKVLPPPPVDASPSVRLAFQFAQTIIRHVAVHLLPAAAFAPMSSLSGDDGAETAGGASPTGAAAAAQAQQASARVAVDRPDLQVLWAMVESALKLVPSARTSAHTPRKRLALFASVAFASRLLAATGKVSEPKWYNEMRNRWRIPEGKQPHDDVGLISQLYLQEVGSREAWASCAITGDIVTPLEDSVVVEAIRPTRSVTSVCSADDETEEETPTEPPARVAASNTSIVASGLSALLPSEGFDLEGGEHASEELEDGAPLQGLPAIFAQLRKKRRLLVTGGPGSGRSVLLQGLLAHACQEFLGSDGNSKGMLPLRVPVEALAALVQEGAPDPIQEYLARTLEEPEASALAFQGLEPPPFPIRWGHQVVSWKRRLYVLGGLGVGNQLLQDAWVSKDFGKTWEELPQPPWCARYSHKAAMIDGKIILVAGLAENDRRLRDAWESQDGCLSWTEMPCPRWAARGAHELVTFEMSLGDGQPKEHLILLGGNGNGNTALHDAWASENGGFSWQELEPPAWPARHSFSAIATKDRIVICGGSGEGGKKFNDAWVMTGNVWRTHDKKALRKQFATDEAASQVMLAKWEKYGDMPWAAREHSQLVFFRDQMVLLGGLNSQGEIAEDAWASPDGTTWAQLPPRVWRGVSARYGHQAICADGRQVVIGGAGRGNQWLGDAHISRVLLLALENLDAVASEDTAATSYLDRVLRTEFSHWVLMTTGPTGLDHLRSMHLQSWNCTCFQMSDLSDDGLRDICRRRLGDLDRVRASRIEEILLDAQYKELARTPLVATLLLHKLVQEGGNTPNRIDIYRRIFELCLQSLASAKRRDTSEFKKLQAAGVDVACCELALEVQSRGGNEITQRDISRLGSGEPLETTFRMGRSGKLVLFSITSEGLRFRNHTVQEFLAAKHLWKRLNGGESLPAWIIREGPGSESAMGCGRFFCALAAECCTLSAARFDALAEGLGGILRNMARVGDQKAADTLLRVAPNRQALLSTVDTSGQCHTALHLAAGYGHAAALRTLLQLAPDPSALNAMVDGNGFLPLHCAANSGHEGTARVLLEMTYDRSDLLQAMDKSEKCYTSMHLAAKNGHYRVVKTMLDLAPCPGLLNAAVDLSGFTPLHLAAQNGHEAAARALLARAHDRGVLVATPNRHERRNPLHLAAECGEESVVRALLELVPNKSSLITKPDKLGQTALHLAAERGHEATIRALLESEQDRATRAELALARENLAGQTALHLAADCGHGAAVRALMELAPDPKALVFAVDRFAKYTALHLAAEKGRAVAARALLERTEDRQELLAMEERFAGQLALHLASAVGNSEVVRALLELAPDKGALLEKGDRAGGFQPLHLAAEQGHDLVAQVLLEFAPDRTAILKAPLERWSGLTPLHLTAYRGHQDAAKVLLQAAPDRRALLSMQDHRGRTPSELALDRGHRELASLLADTP